MSRLRDEIKSATEQLISAEKSAVSVSSGSELFLRFITLTSLEQTVIAMLNIRSDTLCFCTGFRGVQTSSCKKRLVIAKLSFYFS